MTAARQLTLLRPERPSIEERWRAFHAANPAVYETFEALALEAQRMGFTGFGAKAIWEVMRYEMARKRYAAQHGLSALKVERVEGEPKLNNDYPALYAREVMRRRPELRGFFETRGRKA